jgi:hypothetical protein
MGIRRTASCESSPDTFPIVVDALAESGAVRNGTPILSSRIPDDMRSSKEVEDR